MALKIEPNTLCTYPEKRSLNHPVSEYSPISNRDFALNRIFDLEVGQWDELTYGTSKPFADIYLSEYRWWLIMSLGKF
jgi:hypothetical protein